MEEKSLAKYSRNGVGAVNTVRAEKNKNSNEKRKGGFSFVSVVQAVLCLIICAVFLFCAKTGSSSFEKMQRDFKKIFSLSISQLKNENIISTVKDLIEKGSELLPVFNPVKSIDETSGSDKASDGETESSTQKNEESTTAENEAVTQKPEKEKTTAAKETEKAEKTTAVKDAGGDDQPVYKAVQNTSFSPVSTTCPIVAPVNSTRYTSNFGYRINPITGKKSFHTGLDIAAPLGTKIRAAYAGTVKTVGEDDRSGKYIILTHKEGFETFYCHCSKIIAEKGAVLRQGETVALVGSTGWSTGPHLHFEIRKNGERMNPKQVLDN